VKIAIMQPYLFPYIGYFQLINAVDTFVIFNDVNYIQRGYINRNSILLNGRPHRFTLEIVKASQNKLINEIEIGDNKLKILKTIKMAYRKAPYFQDVYPVIEKILFMEERNLSRFLVESLKEISRYLAIDTDFVNSSNIEKDNSLRSQDKIIDICKRLRAGTYINAIGGMSLYEKDRFSKEGICLNFLDSELIDYSQFDNEFVPSLSMIDVMMFNSRYSIMCMLNRYILL